MLRASLPVGKPVAGVAGLPVVSFWWFDLFQDGPVGVTSQASICRLSKTTVFLRLLWSHGSEERLSGWGEISGWAWKTYFLSHIAGILITHALNSTLIFGVTCVAEISGKPLPEKQRLSQIYFNILIFILVLGSELNWLWTDPSFKNRQSSLTIIIRRGRSFRLTCPFFQYWVKIHRGSNPSNFLKARFICV